MPFATALRATLQTRQSQVPAELANGDSLERVLNRHLLAVERMADREMLTSILLLDADGRRLWHGAAPNLPASYRHAIDGGEIGPKAGSCGTATYLGRPVYVSDIATDPLWVDYRDLALPHGLRACWSTPIRDNAGTVIGSFAIYRRSAGEPTANEIEAIEMIAGHVAQAIKWARTGQDLEGPGASEQPKKPALTIVRDARIKDPPPEWFDGLLRSIERLKSHANELDRCAVIPGSEAQAEAIAAVAADCRRLIGLIRSQIEPYGYSDREV